MRLINVDEISIAPSEEGDKTITEMFMSDWFFCLVSRFDLQGFYLIL